ncbi:MAG: hypothetical protein PF505_09195 [Vallitaleaceae bacterium]|jgi:hypothetical protein|nr:hypothetical protein [Vallitaleaceae bacterium]
MRSIYKIAIAIVIIICGFVVYDIVNHPYNGPDHLDEPVQVAIEPFTVSYMDNEGQEVSMTLFASYSALCGVKGVKKYTSDGASVLSPRDFVLTWGDLNAADVDDEISYSQSNRWYYYRYTGDSYVSSDYIGEHSANTHVIPENVVIERRLKKVGKNDLILIEGYLAVVHFDNGDWSSSDTRTDKGNGACEILYVTNIEIY